MKQVLETNYIIDLPIEDLQLLATARASFSAFINTHFMNLPDEEFVQKLYTPDIFQALENFGGEENLHPDIVEGARLMRSYLGETMDLATNELSERLGIDRTRLYRGVSPSYGPPPPFEAVWRVDQAKATMLLQEIAGIYHKNGLAQSPEANERLDYIGVELAFLEHLALDEVDAWEAGDETQALDLLNKQKAFVCDHLAQWVPAFTEKAIEFAQTDFYRGHLLMLSGFVMEQKENLSRRY